MLKIAFLFLIVSSIYHEQHWQDFFTGNEHRFSLYIHTKNPLPPSSFSSRYEIPKRVSTSWAHTMQAQLELLKEALKDPDNAKFVFVSESTIPLKSFDAIHQQLMATNKSMFYYEKSQHHDKNYSNYEPRRDLKPFTPEYQYKNAQWVILNRTHAQLMAQDNHYRRLLVNRFSDQEHYPSTFLAIKGLLHEVMRKDMTYVDWTRRSRVPKTHPYPYYFYDMTNPEDYNMIVQAIEKGFLFARKFTKDCDLSPLDKHLGYRR